jgi:hypothetical protein
VCPSAAEALAHFTDPNDGTTDRSCTITAVIGEGELDGDLCCYDVIQDCPEPKYDQNFGYGCMGRPLVQEGRVVLAAVRDGGGRTPLAPRVEGLSEKQRAELARFWLRVALAEHASIAEFHRVALDLMLHGAPAGLLAKAQVAAVDEARHARRCFAMASAYAGRPLEAGPLPLGANVSLAVDLATLARVTLRGGCVGETCSTWLYARLGERAKDPAARRVMEGIVRDETRHAELAWAILRWAIDQGGDAVREACRVELDVLPPVAGTPPCQDDDTLAAHGWAPAQVQDRIVMDAWKHVVRPLAERLVSAPLSA